MSLKQYFRSFHDAIMWTQSELKTRGRDLDINYWQGIDVKDQPQGEMFELLNHSFSCLVSPHVDMLQAQIQPNQPWADEHFKERVGGIGVNPGETYKIWPFYQHKTNDKQIRSEEKFTHTYMERLWPNNTSMDPFKQEYYPRMGLRYRYGDLDDLVDLLQRDPHTRQAFLPIWYPEDTGAHHGGRVPCTLGYHFMLRQGKLHMWYPIRSCDYLRHFRDDIYLACRMLLWVLDVLRERDTSWEYTQPGILTMQIYSLHIFSAEKGLLK